jgi:hypothetical protein
VIICHGLRSGLKEQEAAETTEEQVLVFSVFFVFNDVPNLPDIPLGLVINFNSPELTDDVLLLTLPGANLD